MLFSCDDGRLHQHHQPVRCLDALQQHGTPGRLGVSRAQHMNIHVLRDVCLDSASASPTPSAMRQDEPAAVWKDMAVDEFPFHGPCSVG